MVTFPRLSACFQIKHFRASLNTKTFLSKSMRIQSPLSAKGHNVSLPATKIKLPLSAKRTLKTQRWVQNLIFNISLKANNVLPVRKPDLCILLYCRGHRKILAAMKLYIHFARRGRKYLPD